MKQVFFYPNTTQRARVKDIYFYPNTTQRAKLKGAWYYPDGVTRRQFFSPGLQVPIINESTYQNYDSSAPYSAYMNLDIGGTAYYTVYGNADFAGDIEYQWLLDGSIADYEYRVRYDAGNPDPFTSGSGVPGTWYPMNASTSSYRTTRTTLGRSVTRFYIDIRDIGTHGTIVSASGFNAFEVTGGPP